MDAKKGWLISELSRRVGIPAQTLRYYERLGLIEPPQRTASRYRIYSSAHEERLQFIQKAKRFGLSLEEIQQLIAIRKAGTPPCASLKVMLKQHLCKLDRRIQEMIELRRELTERYTTLDTLIPDSSTAPSDAICNGKVCGFIERETH